MTNCYLYDRINSMNKLSLTDRDELEPLLLNRDEIAFLQLLGVELLDDFNEEKIQSAKLVIAHLSDDREQSQIFDKNFFYTNCVDTQIFVLISSSSRAMEKDSCIIKDEARSKSRIILYTKDLGLLRRKDILKKLISLSFEDAEKMIESKSTLAIGWNSDPFFVGMDRLIAIYILCQGFFNAYFSNGGNTLDASIPQVKPPPMITESIHGSSPSAKMPQELRHRVQSINWWESALIGEEAAVGEVEAKKLAWEKMKNETCQQWKNYMQMPSEGENPINSLFDQIERSQVSLATIKNIHIKISDYLCKS